MLGLRSSQLGKVFGVGLSQFSKIVNTGARAFFRGAAAVDRRISTNGMAFQRNIRDYLQRGTKFSFEEFSVGAEETPIENPPHGIPAMVVPNKPLPKPPLNGGNGSLIPPMIVPNRPLPKPPTQPSSLVDFLGLSHFTSTTSTMGLVRDIAQNPVRFWDLYHKEQSTLRLPHLGYYPEGGDGKQSDSYAKYLKAYLKIHAVQLSWYPQEQSNIKKLVATFEQLASDRQRILDVLEHYYSSNFGDLDNVPPSDSNRSYQKTINELVTRDMRSLFSKGSCTILSGYGEHYVSKRIESRKMQDGSIQLVELTFNAGAEADWNPHRPGEVWGTTVRPLLCGTVNEIRDYLSLNYEKVLRNSESPYYEYLTASIDAYRGNIIEEQSISVAPQSRGNCTTRSLREMMRHDLFPNVFDSIQQFVRNNGPSNLVALLEATRGQRQILSQITEASRAWERRVCPTSLGQQNNGWQRY